MLSQCNGFLIVLLVGVTVACSGNACPGWVMLDNNPRTRAIFAGGGELYQRHADGSVWEATGQACVGGSCPGWRRLDANPRTSALAASAGPAIPATQRRCDLA